ncbi:MAG: SGNH/GDSL hydrolase family protein [Phycisphaerae bacterium]
MSVDHSIHEKHHSEPKLLIIGDSITLGVADMRGADVLAYVDRTYVDILRERFPRLTMIVDADLHRSTIGGLRCLRPLLETHRPQMTLLMLGGNDADPDWKRFVVSNGRVARSRIEISRYIDNLRSMVEMVRSTGGILILTDMPNQYLARRSKVLSELAGRDLAPLIEACGGEKLCNEVLEKYREAAAALAAQLAVPFAPYGHSLARHPLDQVVGPDGVHPSREAHTIIAEQIIAVLQPMLAGSPAISGSPA